MPVGRAWEALREDEIACRSLGINTTTTKLTAFATGAMFGGFAGSFFAARQGFVSPESFVFLESAIILAIVVLGGMGSLTGIAIAALVMIGGTEILREMQFLKVDLRRRTSRRSSTACCCSASPWSSSCCGSRAASSAAASRPPSCTSARPSPAPSPRKATADEPRCTTMTTPILEVEHLSMKFGGLVAIGDLSFEARRGEITALIGPNGAGKTTVFNCITGFYKPTEGMITLNRQRRQASSCSSACPTTRSRRKAKVARTFQNIRLFSGMTLLENLLVAQHNKLMKASGYTILGLLGIGGYAKASAESVELAKFWLEKADLIDRADDPAGDLPYGAQRRLEIARAMCTGPELLCLDEPAAGLNPKRIAGAQHAADRHQGHHRHVDPADRARHVGGHADFRPRRGARIRPQDLRRQSGIGEERSASVIAAYLGVDDEEVEEVLAEVGDERRHREARRRAGSRAWPRRLPRR